MNGHKDKKPAGTSFKGGAIDALRRSLRENGPATGASAHQDEALHAALRGQAQVEASALKDQPVPSLEGAEDPDPSERVVGLFRPI
ncbi:MAG: hypothetical protein ACPGOY_18055 [Rhodospirillaceae bacterium]